MRILQLIDSLRPGGAEKMAVNYANALASRIEGSFLCCTRMEGQFKTEISPEVEYMFLRKKHALDPIAFWKLRTFVKKNKINLIQAHSSSYFLAVLVKLSLTGVKLVWHDHYGKELDKRKVGPLKQASRYFNGIISVNLPLKEWAKSNLCTPKIIFLNNFLPSRKSSEDSLKLKGDSLIKIICVANFRPQKDHLNLLGAFKMVCQQNNDVSLHLIGKFQDDEYSRQIFKYIQDNIAKRVFVYGEQTAIEDLVSQADLGVLSSVSEGLPVVLLEYARAGVPVICTAVGEVPRVVGTFGKLVDPKDSNALAEAILFYIEHEKERKNDALSFQEKVMQEFSEEAVMFEMMKYLRCKDELVKEAL